MASNSRSRRRTSDETPVASRYVMAPGKCMRTSKGLHEPGDEIKASYFPQEATFWSWVEKGVIVKG